MVCSSKWVYPHHSHFAASLVGQRYEVDESPQAARERSITACPGRDESEPRTWLIIRAALSLERYFYPGVQRAGALGVPSGGFRGLSGYFKLAPLY